MGRNLENALEDTERLKEVAPDDYAVRALHATVLADLGRLAEAEKEPAFVKELGQESDDPNQRVRACLAPAVFAATVQISANPEPPVESTSLPQVRRNVPFESYLTILLFVPSAT